MSKNTPTVDTIEQNSLKVIDSITVELDKQKNTIDSLLIEKKNNHENFERINSKLNSIESSVNKTNGQIRILRNRKAVN